MTNPPDYDDCMCVPGNPIHGCSIHDRYPCPHGCTDHTVASESPTSCGHYHSPSEWGHREQLHNSAYWKAIGESADKSHESAIGLRAERDE